MGELLDHLGKATPELTDALAFARRQAIAGGDVEAIEQRAWNLWDRRSAAGPAFTAVAQLLFAVSRADRHDRQSLAGSCSTPICLLEELESGRGEVFDRVVAHFDGYIGMGPV